MSITARFSIDRGRFSLEVDIEIPERGVTALIGPSGCGKTTLLRAIAGLDSYPHGYLRIGQQIWQDETIFVPTYKRLIGYIFQESNLFAHMTVQKNLNYGLSRVSSDHTVSIDPIIDLLGIGNLMDQYPDTLSGGEQQRVAIARAILTSPRLLLMDEPLASLDLERKLEIMPYIEALNRDLSMPIIYVSHDRDEVVKLADHLLLMNDGQIISSGGITDILTRIDLPLAQSAEAESIISAKVKDYDPKYQLSTLESSLGCVLIPGEKLEIGTDVRLRIPAKDVSLTLVHQTGTSILNIFPATVEQIVGGKTAQVTVKVRAGDTAILARITRKSADNLKLKPGMKVFAQTKSVALLA
ncbi:MAG: molybdenum ABC transporter ATP-binding protein [Candidatus Azotimanducaceae bacterium]|uniref:Molybdenum ABC transporter ATP-binding protein n=1 Tax=OM182 bacterium TaxID=2510334 RepID=A0A520RWH5_9GAMM|nr:molybdenum ABC transporter ATP-binding protein [Gammaproteobacteria bacterium]RZO74599.1 MAG: molybdenum ABC transporter ATP-binding protein [OM182 bacterium]